MSLKVGDLFAGIGGIALGLKNAGFDIAWANEMDDKACITYKTNFKHPLYECPIQNLDPTTLPHVDMLAGGFPCKHLVLQVIEKALEIQGELYFLK